MSLQFIIGGSGSGKTRTLYENLIRQSMEEPDGRFFALVPEQFTMQTQKEIVMLHPTMVWIIYVRSEKRFLTALQKVNIKYILLMRFICFPQVPSMPC